MSEHAILAPSTLARIEQCTGSLIWVAKVPQKTTVHAEEGTRAHEYARQLFERSIKLSDIAVAEMRTHLKGYYNYVKNCIVKLGEKGVVRSLFETRVKLTPNIWGTADVILHNGSSLGVIDLKYGTGVDVPAKDNLQLITYALATMHTLELDPDKVTVVIYQPRIGDSPVKKHVLTRDELTKTYLPRILDIEHKALNEKPFYNSGEHCRFCPGKGKCPEFVHNNAEEKIVGIRKKKARQRDLDLLDNHVRKFG